VIAGRGSAFAVPTTFQPYRRVEHQNKNPRTPNPRPASSARSTSSSLETPHPKPQTSISKPQIRTEDESVIAGRGSATPNPEAPNLIPKLCWRMRDVDRPALGLTNPTPTLSTRTEDESVIAGRGSAFVVPTTFLPYKTVEHQNSNSRTPNPRPASSARSTSSSLETPHPKPQTSKSKSQIRTEDESVIAGRGSAFVVINKNAWRPVFSR